MYYPSGVMVCRGTACCALSDGRTKARPYNRHFSLCPESAYGGIEMDSIKRIMACWINTGILLMVFAGVCHAGAWTLQKRKLYDRLALNWYHAEDQYGPSGHSQDFSA